MFKANLHALLSLLCINFQNEKNFIICLARCERASCTIQSNSDSVFQKQPGGQPATTPSRLHRHLPSVPARPGTSQGFHASATSPSAHSSSLAGRRQDSQTVFLSCHAVCQYTMKAKEPKKTRSVPSQFLFNVNVCQAGCYNRRVSGAMSNGMKIT
jgi:hypothetical protein